MNKEMNLELNNLSYEDKLYVLKYSANINMRKHLINYIKEEDVVKILEWFLLYSKNFILTEILYKIFNEKRLVFNKFELIDLLKDTKMGDIGEIILIKNKRNLSKKNLLKLVTHSSSSKIGEVAFNLIKDKINKKDLLEILTNINIDCYPFKKDLLLKCFNLIKNKNLNKKEIIEIICSCSMLGVSLQAFNIWKHIFKKIDFIKIVDYSDCEEVGQMAERYLNKRLLKYLI